MRKNNKRHTPESFLSRVDKLPEGCWVWTGSRNKKGYGIGSYHNHTISVHRFAYEQTKGRIPAGLTIDHLCRNKLCVNPDHLEAVTLRENIQRSIPFQNRKGRTFASRAVRAVKSFCIHGHALTPENIIHWPSETQRRCKQCYILKRPTSTK